MKIFIYKLFNFAVDHNRIILPTLAGVPGSDYINGNYVKVRINVRLDYSVTLAEPDFEIHVKWWWGGGGGGWFAYLMAFLPSVVGEEAEDEKHFLDISCPVYYIKKKENLCLNACIKNSKSQL